MTRVGAQAVGEQAAGGAGADHDVVELRCIGWCVGHQDGTFGVAVRRRRHTDGALLHAKEARAALSGLPEAPTMAVVERYADNPAGYWRTHGPCLEAAPLLDRFTLG